MTGSLFFAQAAPDVTKDRLRAEFEKFGPIIGIEFIRAANHSSDDVAGTSSGCGYIVFETVEAAQHAASSMHGTTELAAAGGMVLVCASALSTPSTSTRTPSHHEATTAEQASSHELHDDASALDSPSSSTSCAHVSTSDDPREMEKCARTVFFARVPPLVNEDVIERIFATCGDVLDVNLYKPWATSKTSKVSFCSTESLQLPSLVLHV